MKYIPVSVSRVVGRQSLKIAKHSPTLLFAAGVVGVGATVVLACRATLRLEAEVEQYEDALKIIDEAKRFRAVYTDQDVRHDQRLARIRFFTTVTKLYAPAVIAGGLSVAALTGSHKILTNRNAGLTAAYAALDKGFREYRKRVVDELGEEKDREFRYGAEPTEVTDKKTGESVTLKNVKGPSQHGSIYARFFDEDNQNWQTDPDRNLFFISTQQNWLNDMLKARGHVFLNEAYDMLGLDRTKAGSQVGWLWRPGDSGYANKVSFGLYDRDGQLINYMMGREGSILVDFNVDGVIWKDI